MGHFFAKARARGRACLRRNSWGLRGSVLLPGGLFMLLAVPQAFAHAHLVSSDPAVGSTVAATDTVTITFSEGIELKLSKFTVLMEMPGMDPMSVPMLPAALDGGGNTVVVIKAKQPFEPGLWHVHWKVVSVDTHKTEGTFDFAVKP